MYHKTQATLHICSSFHTLQKILLGIVCTETLACWCVVVYLLRREYYECALEIYEKLRGHKHPSVAKVLMNLGNIWEGEADKAKAISLYQEHWLSKKRFLDLIIWK